MDKKVYEICNNDLKTAAFRNTQFLLFAEGGAMGEPGAVIMITSDCRIYHCNYVFGDVKIEKLEKALPFLRQCEFGMFGIDSKMPSGWNYVYLGAGNHLIVHDDVYKEFDDIVGIDIEPSELYGIWLDTAWKIVTDKVKDKLNKHRIITQELVHGANIPDCIQVNEEKSNEWELDNVKEYKDLVAQAKEVWCARVRNGSYGNKRIQFTDCKAWFSDKCNEINLWTYWQGHGLTDFSDVKIMLVGQDWGSEKFETDSIKRIQEIQNNERKIDFDKNMKSHTNKNLYELFLCLGYDISEPNQQLFFTNYCLGYRSGSETGNMTKTLLSKDKDAFDKLVDIVQPKVIICLGKLVSEMVIGGTIKEFGKKLDNGVISSNYPNHNNIKVYCVGHCGSRGVSNRGGLDNMKRDWQNIKKDMERVNLI